MQTTSLSQKIGWALMAFLATAVVLVAVTPYIINPLENSGFLAESFLSQPLWVYLHIAGGSMALLLGPFQFLKGLRDKRRNLHRWLGRIYLIAILIGGTAGAVIARRSPAGLTGTVGFTLLALLWLYTAFMAYTTILRGDQDAHQEWMTRNFALTFAAVTLRLYIGVGMAVLAPNVDATYAGDMDALFMDIYRTVPWLCWVPNLIIAEQINTRRRARRETLRLGHRHTIDTTQPAAAK